MTDDVYQVLDHVPDDVPPYSITSDGVNWAAIEGWTMNNLMSGAVITSEEVIPFSEITLEDSHVVNGHLVDSLSWEELDMATAVHVPGSGVFLALSTVDEGDVFTVLLPYGLFGAAFGAPTAFREAASGMVGRLVEQGSVDVFDGNLDWLFAAPVEPSRSVRLRQLSPAVPAPGKGARGTADA